MSRHLAMSDPIVHPSVTPDPTARRLAALVAFALLVVLVLAIGTAVLA